MKLFTEHISLKTNKLILLQISTGSPRDKEMKRSSSHEAVTIFGGLAEASFSTPSVEQVFSQPSIYIDGWLYAMSMTSVVCNVPVLSQNDSTYHHSVFTT